MLLQHRRPLGSQQGLQWACSQLLALQQEVQLNGRRAEAIRERRLTC